MVRSDPIAEVDEGIRELLSPYAQAEIEEGGPYFDELVRKSCTLHMVSRDNRFLAVVGVAKKTMLGVETFWFLLAADLRVSDLRALKQITPNLFNYHARVETAVEIGYDVGVRFARFFGFRPIPTVFELAGRTYQLYEARKWQA